MKRSYIFREGSRVSGVSPDTAAKELERIRKQHGAVTPESVVAEARPEDAPLHPTFEWDNGVAGEKYRLIQARTLIRAVQVVTDDEKPTTVYTYVPPPQPAGSGEYHPTATIAQQVDRYALALSDAMRFLRSAQDRVDELKRAAGGQPDKVAAITLAAQALTTAEQAIKSLAA